MVKNQNLIFKDSELVRDAIMESQKKEIAMLYDKWAIEIEKKAKYYSHKTNASAEVSERYYKELKKQIKATSQEISNEIYNKIKNNMYIVSDAVVKDNVNWLSSFGFEKKGLNAAFSFVPDSIVRNLVTGQVYESGWSLSERIWGNNEATLKEIYQVMAGGLAQNKNIYEIAKDLEMYVKPGAKAPWNLKDKDGKRIYRRQVDYNAQRLARSLTQHTYQQSFVASTQKNPFVLDYIWRSLGSRVCDLCKSRDGNHYSKDDLPLDHPNGMCTMEPNVDENMTSKLADWFNSPDGTYPEIDAFAGNFGYKVSKIGSVQDFIDKYGTSTKSPSAWFNSLTQIQKAEAKVLKESSGLTWNKWYEEYIFENKNEVIKSATKTAKTITKNADKIDDAAKTTKNVFDAIKKEIDDLANKVYSGIWKEDVTPMDYLEKKASIQAKKKLYTSKIEKYSSKSYSEIPWAKDEVIKMKKHLNDLEDFEKRGKAFVRAQKQLGNDAYKASKAIANSTNVKFNVNEWTHAMRKNDLGKMEHWCDNWVDHISKDEKHGIQMYTDDAYVDMNEYLRGITSETRYKKEINKCTEALKKASLPKDVIVRRGSDYNMLNKFGIEISESNKKKFVGAMVTDKGFTSTSPALSGGFSGDIEYIIKVPRGSQAMYIDKISYHRGEQELLINRGGKFIIEDIEFNSNGGVRKIYMTLKNLK